MTSELIQNSIANAAKAHLMYLIAGFHRAVLGHVSSVSSVDICVEHCHGGTQHVEYRGVHRHTLHLAASHHCCTGALWVCCSFEDEVTSIVSPVPVFISVDFDLCLAVQCSLCYKCCASHPLVMPQCTAPIPPPLTPQLSQFWWNFHILTQYKLYILAFNTGWVVAGSSLPLIITFTHLLEVMSPHIPFPSSNLFNHVRKCLLKIVQVPFLPFRDLLPSPLCLIMKNFN